MIIKEVEVQPVLRDVLNYFPDQFVPEKKKLEDKTWIKNTLDFFANIGFDQIRQNRETIGLNYKYFKGDIDWRYFHRADLPIEGDFLSQIKPDQPLPSHVRHYPIWNRPINTMVGELTKRPDNRRVRAYDDDSKSEEMEYKTTLVQQLIMQQARNQIMQEYAIEGQELNDQDLEQLTVEKVKDYLTDYTSLAERWGNHVLTAMKPSLEMKDKGEEAFTDLLKGAREFWHIYEDNSKRGFSLEVENPVNVFHPPHNNKRYSRDWYYGGILKVMEISEIIEKIPGITKEEIDHLVEQVQSPNRMTPGKSNFDTLGTGPDTIKYDTYHRLEEQERQLIAAEMEASENEQTIDFLNPLTASPLSQKFAVMRVYWLSKKLIGKLTYVDSEGDIRTVPVDETYEEGAPNELAIEWAWVNQWYMGVRIGTEVYKVQPFKALEYIPIIGVTHDIKNANAKSVVDMLMNFQVIYDVNVNQLWELTEKEIGNVADINLRRIPIPKDGDYQDAIAEWEAEVRARGIMFEDDSPENMRVPSSNTNLTRNVDLGRYKEMQERRANAEWAKLQAMELVGMTEQRMGTVQATETATGTQAAISQSFAQTEPYFAQHEYVMDQVYQAILDMTQHIETNKPLSTLSYITASGESAFIQVTPQDIKFKDLHVFATSRTEDQQLFQELRGLAQPMLQNGATPYEIAELFSTNSIRQLKGIFKALNDKNMAMYQQEQDLKNQDLQQRQQQFEQQLQEQARQHQLEIVNENYQRELDRKNDLEIAIINAMGRAKTTGTDANADGVPDIYQTQDLINQYNSQLEQSKQNLAKLDLERSKLMQEGLLRKREIEQRDRELDISEKNQKNDEKIAKIKLQTEKVKASAARHKAAEAKKKPAAKK